MPKSLIEKFLDFEEKNDLFSIELNNIAIWPILRFSIFTIINQKVKKFEINHPKRNTLSTIALIIRNLPQSIIKSPFFLQQKDSIIFNHPRKILNEEGFYECKYTEHLSGEKSYIFEVPFQGKHFSPSSSATNLIYLDLLLDLSRIYSLFQTRSKKNDKTFHFLISEIEKEFNISLPAGKLLAKRLFYKHKALLYLSKIILVRIKPKKIFVTVAYSDINLPFVQQAKKLGIKVIEQQHGIMGDSHIAYNFSSRKQFDWYPDEIWVWNRHWAKNSRFPISSENIIIKKFRYLEKFKSSYSSHEVKKTILFISQGPFATKLMLLAIELAKEINSESYNIIFKLHPSEYLQEKDKFKKLNDYNIQISTDNNIYKVFSQAYCQIGVNSTALFEGMEFGLKTFIYKIEGWEVFKNVEDVYLVNGAKEIANTL